MMKRPAMAGLALWTTLILASCGGNEPDTNAAGSSDPTITQPAPVVREWYPRPKHMPRSFVQFEPPLQGRQAPGSQDYWATTGQQYQQRPWGETTHRVTPGNRSPRLQPQGVVTPYSTWQPGMAAHPGYPYAGVPYGVNPGGGYPGFIW